MIPTLHAKVHAHSDACWCEFCCGGFVQYTCPACGERRMIAVAPGTQANILFCRCELVIVTPNDLLEADG